MSALPERLRATLERWRLTSERRADGLPCEGGEFAPSTSQHWYDMGEHDTLDLCANEVEKVLAELAAQQPEPPAAGELPAEVESVVQAIGEVVEDGYRAGYRDGEEQQILQAHGWNSLLRTARPAVLAALRPLLAPAPTEGCPCLYTAPCHDGCACVKPWSSRSCRRCAGYGSPEQRRVVAERLAALVDAAPAEVAGWEQVEAMARALLWWRCSYCGETGQHDELLPDPDHPCGQDKCPRCGNEGYINCCYADRESASEEEAVGAGGVLLSDVLAAIKPLWPPARLKAVRELLADLERPDPGIARDRPVDPDASDGERSYIHGRDFGVREERGALASRLRAALGLPAKEEEHG